MKYYLKNISSLIYRPVNSQFNSFFDHIVIKQIDEFELVIIKDTYSNVITNWLKNKEIYKEKTKIDYGLFIDIFGLHVFLTEEDEEFLFYIKLKYPQILER